MLLRYRYYLSEVIRVRSQRAGPYAWMATPLLLLLVASTNTPSIQWQGKPGDVFANTFLISFQSRKSQRWQYKIFVILLCVSCLSKNHQDLTCSLPVDGSDHATSSALPFGLAELPPPAVIGITASQSRHSLSPLYVNNPRDSLYTSIHKVLVGSEPRDIGTVGLSPPCSARQHGGKHRYLIDQPFINVRGFGMFLKCHDCALVHLNMHALNIFITPHMCCTVSLSNGVDRF